MESKPANQRVGTEPLRRFTAPRYWSAWLALAVLRLIVLLPHPATLAIGRMLGRVLHRLSRSRRAVARRNLELCFPDLDNGAREHLLKQHFEHLGMILVESALAWWASDRKLRPLGEPEGLEYLHEGLREGRGVILLGAHLGSLDLGGRLLNHFASFKVVHRPLSHPLANEVMQRGRMRFGTEHIRKDDFRAIVRELKRNGVVWFAPDQAHMGANSAEVPFFSIPVPTNTACSRLARMSGATVIPFFSLRKPDGSGYLLKFMPPLADFPGRDAAGDATRMNRLLETEIRKAPEQYYWIHRRFKGQYGA